MSSASKPVRLRMPTCFGPAPSPRQNTSGSRWSSPLGDFSIVARSFLTDEAKLTSLLPPGATLDGEPVVTLEFNYRSYNTLGLRFPIRLAQHHVRGPFLTVLWENLTDPILTGREEVGFAKLLCDLPDADTSGPSIACSASWGGHRFVEMTVEDLATAPEPGPSDEDGMLHYYTMPRIGRPGATVAEGWVISPPWPSVELQSFRSGVGRFNLLPSTWQQLPTLVHIVDRKRELPVIEDRGAFAMGLRVDASLHNQHMLG